MPKRITKEQLEQDIRYLKTLIISKDEEIMKLKAELKVTGLVHQHLSAMSIACERTSDAMAHIVHDMLEFTKRR